MNYLEEIQELVDHSYELQDNITKVNIIESAIKLADSQQDIEVGLRLRIYLMSTLCKCGYPEKLLVAFSWCLAQYDRDPEQLACYERRLMWNYKWIIPKLACFPNISQQQIESTFADMERRYLSSGRSLRAVYHKRTSTAILMGNCTLASQYYQQWQETAADSSQDCAGCELAEEVDYLLFIGREEEAINQAKPISSGKIKCTELPQYTVSKLLIPLVKSKQLDTAISYHLTSWHLVSENDGLLEQLSEEILFLVLTKNIVKAIDLLEKNISIALTTYAIGSRFYFFRAVYFLMDCLRDKKVGSVSLFLPNNFPLYQVDGKYQVEALANWFKLEAENIAKQFDLRNENNYFSNLLSGLRELKQYQVDYPINQEAKLNHSVNLNRGDVLKSSQ